MTTHEPVHERRGTIRALWAIASGLLFAIAVMHQAGAEVELGPRIEREDESQAARAATRPVLDIPPLRLAIPVLDPGLPENRAVWEKRGIWPELRRAEGVRCAERIADAIRSLGHFESVIVAPDTSVSADLYLLGEIGASNGEDLKIEYRLLDATGKTWIQKKTARHRVPLGWHENNTDRQADPFDVVYAAIARDVEKSLTAQARRHAGTVKQNAKRIARGKSPKMSDLDKVALTRDLVLAGYFAPDRYGDALKRSGGRVKIQFVPYTEDEDWVRIESVSVRDDAFSERLSGEYAAFADKMQGSYALWQQDSFPYAREQRILRERATAQGVLGALAAVATVAAAADGDVGTLPTVAAGVASTALIVSSFRTNAKRKEQVRHLNEIGRSLQAELTPSVVEMRESTVTLRGTAREQFQQWRSLLREIYANDAEDFEAVNVVAADAGVDS